MSRDSKAPKSNYKIIEKQQSYKEVHLAQLEAKNGLELLNVLATNHFSFS